MINTALRRWEAAHTNPVNSCQQSKSLSESHLCLDSKIGIGKRACRHQLQNCRLSRSWQRRRVGRSPAHAAGSWPPGLWFPTWRSVQVFAIRAIWIRCFKRTLGVTPGRSNSRSPRTRRDGVQSGNRLRFGEINRLGAWSDRYSL